MDRVGLFVDAGYLIGEGGKLVLGRSRRSEYTTDVVALHQRLLDAVEEAVDIPRLRTYWYDGVRDGQLTAEHEALQSCSYVKLRLGRLTANGQKGVDSLIFRDLTSLARNRAIVTAYLVAGDEDLREAVAMAQELGIQVHLALVETRNGRPNYSQALANEADEVFPIGADWLRPYFEA